MKTPKPKVTVASYNVLCTSCIRKEYFGHVPEVDLRRDVRDPRLIDRIMGLKADVYCLQEVDYLLFSTLEAKLRSLGYRGRWAHKGKGKPDGLAIFARKELDWQQTTIVTFSADERDLMMQCHLALGDFRFSVANAHLRYDQPGTSPIASIGLSEARELLQVCSRHFPPTLICGDFNATPDSDVLQLFVENGYRDAFDAEAPTGTFNGTIRKIDYILHPRALAPSSAHQDRIGPDEVLPSASQPSDHLPLTATFSPAF